LVGKTKGKGKGFHLEKKGVEKDKKGVIQHMPRVVASIPYNDPLSRGN